MDTQEAESIIDQAVRGAVAAAVRAIATRVIEEEMTRPLEEQLQDKPGKIDRSFEGVIKSRTLDAMRYIARQH